jgi:HTH-type transcriptional regulator/antitoxin HigA
MMKGGEDMETSASGSGRAYEPDYAVSPGETLAEMLNERGMSQAELARRTGISTKHINLILKGSAPISPETALKLERVLNVPARVWNALEATYRGHLSRMEESRQLQQHVGWASKALVKELIRRGCISQFADRVEQLREVLRFFGVASVTAWNAIWDQSAATAAYRKAKLEGDPVALAAWMRIGELRAGEVAARPFDRERFRRVLEEVRRLTRETDPEVWCPQLEQLCLSAGVVVVIESELPKARVNGIARWITPTTVLIQLSLRYLRDDIFWFTFFHEAAHLLLHGKRAGPKDVPQTFIDMKPDLPMFVDTGKSAGQREDEANAFAANILVPPETAARLPLITTLDDVRTLASEVGVSPGIIVGRLHHEEIKPHNWGTALFVRYQFVD